MKKIAEFYPRFERLKKDKSDFKTCSGSNSMTIEQDGEKTIYIREPRSFDFINVAQKVKRYLVQNPTWVGNPKEAVYYINQLPRQTVRYAQIHAVDISSAYPTVLELDGILPPYLIAEMNALTKTEKLAVIGMLARRKSWTVYRKGRNVDYEIGSDSSTAQYYYHCANRIYSLMNDARTHTDSFLFSWVDCAYFWREDCAKTAVALFKEQGFSFKQKFYTNFEAIVSNACHLVQYDDEMHDRVGMGVPNVHSRNEGNRALTIRMVQSDYQDSLAEMNDRLVLQNMENAYGENWNWANAAIAAKSGFSVC